MLWGDWKIDLMNTRYHFLTLRFFRPCFTLVELLIAISIIGILASMVLFTLAGAQRDAKMAKTKATIEKINSVLMERFEEYRYRSVKLPVPISLTRKDPGTGIVALKQKDLARVRTVVLKDIMRMEMPDRMSDLEYAPTNVLFPIETPSGLVTVNLNTAPFTGRYSPREYNILRNYFDLPTVPEPWAGGITQSTSATWTSEWESAECLYAIVAHSTVAGGPALEGFHPTEVGDKDGDSYPEFWDAWENPIGWLRWPAAYPSALNLSYKQMVMNSAGSSMEPASPDAFDPYRTARDSTGVSYWSASRTQMPWTLVPLIISAGPDGDFGIDSAVALPYADLNNQNPYYPSPESPSVGIIVNAVATQDNISNHDLLLE
jgi:prepilin-type N-terminal cleavage/methylation domain-containing protein